MEIGSRISVGVHDADEDEWPDATVTLFTQARIFISLHFTTAKGEEIELDNYVLTDSYDHDSDGLITIEIQSPDGLTEYVVTPQKGG